MSDSGNDTPTGRLGDDRTGGPADAGQRPAHSHSEPPAGGSPESRSEREDLATNSARDEERGGATGGTESTEPAVESAERFPRKEGREDGSMPGPDDQFPGDDPLSEALRERDDYRDALIRLQADFENYKKRMLKQQTEYLERAAAQLVDKLLPVLDAADLALAHGGGEDIKQVTGALMSALEKEGLERVAGEGSPFDPTLHDAVVHEPAEEHGEQTVTEVLRAGYKWKGRVLRPAMVKVRG
ncbi:MAG TPA: nucleotide exchange factor GrpE [Acidimicrobiales bacterium]